MSEKEGIIMICRKCGCMLESGTRICPFCGEPATLAASPVVEGLPELVLLNELAPVPATREETLAELRRLESYFGELDTKYATLADLWLKSACWQPPSRVRWAVGGFLLALLLYLLVGIHLPAMAVWIFVVLWGVIAYFGYSRSCARTMRRAFRRMSAPSARLRTRYAATTTRRRIASCRSTTRRLPC